MEVLHDTPFVGALLPYLDRNGQEARLALLKATFEIQRGGRLTVSAVQQPIHLADQYLKGPGSSVFTRVTAHTRRLGRISP